jgi:hypothetical protein
VVLSELAEGLGVDLSDLVQTVHVVGDAV